MQLTRTQIHARIYYFGLIFMVISLPLSVFTLSLSQIILLLNWLVEGQFYEKWRRFRRQKVLWLFVAFYALHLLSLLWSSDLTYGLKDLKIKLSLLVLPLVMGTSRELEFGQFKRILQFFCIAVFISSMASVLALLGWIGVEIRGYRGLSLFMSHIRFALMVDTAILILFWLLVFRRNFINRREGIFYLSGIIWFLVFLVLLKSLSGILILLILAFFLLLRLVFEIRDVAIRFMVFVPVIMIPLFSVVYLGYALNRYYSFEEIHFDQIDSHTALGNPYKNYPNLQEVENGHYVWIHICDMELEQEWEKLSPLDFWGRTYNGHSLRTTLIRYMTSRGLRKDAAGMQALAESEIRAIEQGVANYLYLERFSLYPRIYELIWEIDRYRLGYSPNEKSMIQRYLYLEAGWQIFKEHPWIGVGNGDVNREFQAYYDKVNSPLSPKWRRRAHNQFLTFLISFGIPGFILCMTTLVAPLFLSGRQRSFLATSFFILMLLSMINEDTLETAVGASFIAAFYSLFIFGPDTPWLRTRLFHGRRRQA